MNELGPNLPSHISEAILAEQITADKIKTLWVKKEHIIRLMRFFKEEIFKPFNMLYDLSAIDERNREKHYSPLKKTPFSVVYHLLSLERNEDLRLKVPLDELYPSIDSVTSVFANANWYEREVFDMFGIKFVGHPHLVRILMPDFWQGHPLRKDHPARATDMPPFSLAKEEIDETEKYFINKKAHNHEHLFLNLGPQHPGTHGILRILLEMHGEEIIDAALLIGYHHRGAEKMAERQSFHSFIPYTDRIDYLGGVMNNLPYLLALEQLAQITVPKRAQVIRIMLAELFRLASHLVWFGTFAQDIGALSPVFYAFADRERIFDIVSAITGARMHPSWFRIGGVADDLPEGWQNPVREFVASFPKRIKELNDLVMKNSIFKARTIGIGAYSKKEAIEWGVTGAGLRACGLDWDFRKKRPYSSYEDFDFDIPTAVNGDCYDRAVVRIEEMYQSTRIIEQCIDRMPKGEYKSDHPLATPPKKDKTLVHIETLIHHFLSTSMGPVMPAGESFFGIEASKGNNGYYLISDQATMSYRTRIRTPSFAHMQMLPKLAKGGTIADLMAILGSIDFVLADLDR